TALRLAEARRRGQVARSADLTTAVVLAAAVGVLWWVSESLMNELRQMTTAMLTFDPPKPDGASLAAAGGLLWSAVGPLLGVITPVLVALGAVAMLTGFAQVGLPAGSEAIHPQWERLWPSAGLRRMVSSRGAVRAVLAILKLTGVALVSFVTIRSQLPRIEAACAGGVGDLAEAVGRMAASLSLRVVAVLVVLGVVDLVYQRRQHRRDLMMTRREVQEDLRKMEGDPLIAVWRRRVRKDVGNG
ncbi:MAG: EscU/YscU/HrcU family type III secretion system export apparatus switch protein, partial [Phycisphaerae bacterium]|nr:EscU/YscU/HrcU family type III secretion system export apparatus switch protein [Phycisphaerae bacterium]